MMHTIIIPLENTVTLCLGPLPLAVILIKIPILGFYRSFLGLKHTTQNSILLNTFLTRAHTCP